MSDLLYAFSGWFRPHLTFIASAYIATILVIYGARLNKAVWALVKGAHFIVRTLVFVALCAIGYGTISVYLVPVVRDVLLLAGALWLGPLVVLSFLLIGWLAEHHSRKG
jgi:cation transport ATPase